MKSAETDAGEPDEDIPELHATDDLVARGNPAIGEKDEADRYSAAVVVAARRPPDEPRPYRDCSGVLVASNLALTAAHCMCARPSRGEAIRFDRSRCATKADVRISEFTPIVGGSGEVRVDHLAGSILIHPEFQMALDAQGAVVTSRADLALIRFERPIRPEIQIRPVQLAREEVKSGEVLSIVGFPYMDDIGAMPEIYGHWFSREKVQTPTGDDRLLFGPMRLASYKGDTGGPCLRETKRGPEVVGVSQRGLGLTPTFTRLAPYREWLQEQIRLASERR